MSIVYCSRSKARGAGDVNGVRGSAAFETGDRITLAFSPGDGL